MYLQTFYKTMMTCVYCCRPGCEQHNKRVSVTSSYNMQYKYNMVNNGCTKSADSAAKVSHSHTIHNIATQSRVLDTGEMVHFTKQSKGWNTTSV